MLGTNPDAAPNPISWVRALVIALTLPLDRSGQPLDGSKHSYTLTFDKDHIPPVKYFSLNVL